MKKGYTIHNHISGNSFTFILVSNYTGINEVANYAWYNEPVKADETDIGFWRIKKKKHE